VLASTAQFKRCLGPLATLLAVLGAAGSARAQSGTGPAVAWQVPSECPDASAFAAHLQRYLGTSDAIAGVSIDVVITSTGNGFRLIWKMESDEASGERSLSGADCALLTETAALTVALAIDPEAVNVAEEDPTAFMSDDDERPSVIAKLPDELARIPDALVERPHPRRRLLGLILRATVGGDAGSMPGLITPGLGAAIGPRWGLWRLEFTGTYWFEQRARLGDDDDVGGLISLWVTSFRGCRDLLQLSGMWSACLGVEAGKMAGRGFGVDLPETGSEVWLAGTGSVAGTWNLAKFLYFRTELQLGAPVYRFRFVITPGDQLLHQPWYLHTRALTGLELQFR